MKCNESGDIYIQFLGGASEVGATSIYIYWKGNTILIDSGKRRSGNEYPIFNEINKEIDVFILTHVHQDHVGSLVECANSLNIKKFLTSNENKEILPIVLNDTAKFYKDNELYNDENIEKIVSSFETLSFNQTIRIGKNDLKVTFYETSHLLGSLAILLEGNGYSLFLTSDFTESRKFFHPNTKFIEKLSKKHIDTLVTETTYGKNEEGDKVLKQQCMDDLTHALNNIFKNGNALIPCFAIGRMQEVILSILKLIFIGKLPFDTKIYIFKNGNQKTLGYEVTEKYFQKYMNILKEELMDIDTDNKKQLHRFFDEFNNIESKDYFSYIVKSKYLGIYHYNRINLENKIMSEKNSIFLMQPGMLGSLGETDENKQHRNKIALEIMAGEKHGIIFVGYQAPGTVGERIQNLRYNEKTTVFGVEYIKKNKNIYNVTFPGHVSITGIKNIIHTLNADNVLLVHGDINASRTVAKSIIDKNIRIPEIDEKVYLMDNNKKIFFSMEHKHSVIIVDLLNEYILKNKDTNILDNEEYNDYKVIQAVKNNITGNIEEKLLHFEFLTSNQKSLLFYEKLKNELILRNITANVNIINIESTELIEDLSSLIADTDEKNKICVIDCPFELLSQILAISQIAGNNLYLYENDKIEEIPIFPFDLAVEKTYKSTFNHADKDKSELEVLLNRINFYRGRGRERDKERNIQRPKYKIDLPLYEHSIFFKEDRSLWGDIRTMYGIKNKGVVEDIESIYKVLNQQIESIEMLNYVYSYNQNKEYREIIGVNGNRIYCKYYLVNGIQFFSINLKDSYDIKNKISNNQSEVNEIIMKIGKYKELVGE